MTDTQSTFEVGTDSFKDSDMSNNQESHNSEDETESR